MADAELTIKQILDLAWVRRLSRAAMILVIPLISVGGSAIGWIIWQNYQAADKAVVAADIAAKTAAAAVEIAEDVKAIQIERAALADTRAADDKAWRDRLDAGLTRVNQRISTELGALKDDVGDLKGAIGEHKGLIVSDRAASLPWGSFPPPVELVAGGKIN